VVYIDFQAAFDSVARKKNFCVNC